MLTNASLSSAEMRNRLGRQSRRYAAIDTPTNKAMMPIAGIALRIPADIGETIVAKYHCGRARSSQIALPIPVYYRFRVNSRIASSSPASVSGYMRSFINSRMILMDCE